MGSKKLIIRILVVVMILAGLGMILYPVYTNYISSRNISSELSQWEESEQGPSPGKEDEGESNGTSQESGLASEEIPEDAEDNPVMDFGPDGLETEGSGDLSAEDFFPMKITIPRIELEYVVLEGTDSATLKKGAGHESITPLPGQEGRCTISGHRTTYGAPFNRVDELEEGDLIYLETLDNRTYVYSVTGQDIVKPTDVWILEGSSKKELLLTACHPKYSAATRIIIISELLELFPFGVET